MRELDRYYEAIAAGREREAVGTAFVAAWDAVEAAYLRRLREATADAESWRERFRAAAGETLFLVESHPREARFLAVDGVGVGEVAAARRRDLGARLAEMVDSARAELDDPDAVPAATAGWILGIFFHRIYRRLTTGTGPTLPAQLPELLFLGVSAYFGAEAGLLELI